MNILLNIIISNQNLYHTLQALEKIWIKSQNDMQVIKGIFNDKFTL